MKAPKLLKIVKRYLSADENKQQKHIECFTDVLKKLKKKERALKNKLEHEHNDKNRQKIKKDLAIIYAQRKKGIHAIKAAKKAK